MMKNEGQDKEDSLTEKKWRDAPLSMFGVSIWELLMDMGNPDAQEQAHRRFERLCELVGQAYPNHEYQTDDEIQANPVTPLLMRYVLEALKNYGAEVAKGSNVGTTERRKFLAKSFGVENVGWGGNTLGKRWTESLKFSVGERFHSALYDGVEKDGLSAKDAWFRAFDTAYRYVYPEPDGGRDERQTLKNQKELAVELARMGYDLRHFIKGA